MGRYDKHKNIIKMMYLSTVSFTYSTSVCDIPMCDIICINQFTEFSSSVTLPCHSVTLFISTVEYQQGSRWQEPK